ncbi:MAG: hypothetical protein M5U28_15740 [Sandaracinaceae bacterium]|nr:hypothetical protein [Sandaracinaceae bacterium]
MRAPAKVRSIPDAAAVVVVQAAAEREHLGEGAHERARVEGDLRVAAEAGLPRVLEQGAIHALSLPHQQREAEASLRVRAERREPGLRRLDRASVAGPVGEQEQRLGRARRGHRVEDGARPIERVAAGRLSRVAREVSAGLGREPARPLLPLAADQELARRDEARAAHLARRQLVEPRDHDLIAVLQRAREGQGRHHHEPPRIRSIHAARVVEHQQVLPVRRLLRRGRRGEEREEQQQVSHEAHRAPTVGDRLARGQSERTGGIPPAGRRILLAPCRSSPPRVSCSSSPRGRASRRSA